MRKLGILVMALVLVVGMSSGVMADMGDHEVDFSIDVGKFAQIDLPDSLSLVLDELEGPNVTQEFDVTVRANTAVNTSVSMTFSNWEKVFPNTSKSEALFGSGSNWIISPNIGFNYNESGDYFANHAQGWTFDGLKGGYKLSTLSTTTNAEVTDHLKFESNINENADFHKFNAGETLNGTLIFTVSAD